MTRRFHLRGFTSFAVTISFLTLAVSGIVLYLSPRGRVANWTGWGFLGVGKESWGALHTVMALAFLGFAGLHFYLNWKPFMNYLRNKAAGGIKLKRELVAAIVLSAVVIGGTLLNVPPFSAVTTLAENVKDYWETTEVPAPYTHAELSTVAEFAEKTGATVDEVTAKLEDSGIGITDPNQTIGDIAAAHGVSPSTLFARTATGNDGESKPGTRSSYGMGRKTFQQVCADAHVPVESALATLRAAGIEAQANENMRTIAERSGKNPHDLLALIVPTAN